MAELIQMNAESRYIQSPQLVNMFYITNLVNAILGLFHCRYQLVGDFIIHGSIKHG